MLFITLLPFMREIFAIPISFNLNNFITCAILALTSSLIMEVSKFIKIK